jgi:hypothetical protein
MVAVPVYKEAAAAVLEELKTCPEKRDVASFHTDHSSVRHFDTVADDFSRSWPSFSTSSE